MSQILGPTTGSGAGHRRPPLHDVAGVSKTTPPPGRARAISGLFSTAKRAPNHRCLRAYSLRASPAPALALVGLVRITLVNHVSHDLSRCPNACTAVSLMISMLWVLIPKGRIGTTIFGHASPPFHEWPDVIKTTCFRVEPEPSPDCFQRPNEVASIVVRGLSVTYGMTHQSWPWWAFGR